MTSIAADDAVLISRIVLWSLPFVFVLLGFFGRRLLNTIDKLSSTVAKLDKTIAIMDHRLNHMEDRQQEMHEENRARLDK